MIDILIKSLSKSSIFHIYIKFTVLQQISVFKNCFQHFSVNEWLLLDLARVIAILCVLQRVL